MSRTNRRAIRVQTELAAAEMSRMLIGPAAKLLGDKRLLIAADGALLFVPFAALPSPVGGDRKDGASRRPLIADHEIIVLPSGSVVAALRRETHERRRASRSVAVFADPVLEKNDERIRANQVAAKSGRPKLPLVNIERNALTDDLIRSARDSGARFERLAFTLEEAEAILALAGDGLKAVGFDASRKMAVAEQISQYRIVHFATHGIINSRHAELSGIVLSLVDEEGRAQDGFLRVHEIYNLKLSADLVVLSACQTALGREIRGEGMIGLVRAFMYAGAPRVVASLWNVNDLATAELMKRFYRKMLVEGMRPAAALRAAQISMMEEKRLADPYYWAPFVIQGEWK
jgi:CHAT domain-containing protein